MGKDYYKILGVDKNASADEIKKAFRKLAHEHHPDKAHGNEAKFKEINEAYQVLGDQTKRSRYDQFGPGFEQGQAGGRPGAGFEGFSGFSQGFNMDDLGDIFGGFGDIFSGFGGRQGSRADKRRGHDLQVSLEISFSEAVSGVEKQIKINRRVKCSRCEGSGAEPGSKIENCKTCGGRGKIISSQRTIFGAMQFESECPDCGGTGKKAEKVCSKCNGRTWEQREETIKIKIPAGIDTGERIKFSNMGDAGEKGASSGDLYIQVRVASDRRFRREGSSIYTKKEVPFTMAVFGGKLEIETVYGPFMLKIPEGTKSGTVFRLKEKGMANVNGRGKGDQFVEVEIAMPKHLNSKQRKLLEELGKEGI